MHTGHINLINLSWELPDSNNPEYAEDVGCYEDPTDDGFPPIESCKMWDVGWMRCSRGFVMSSLYAYLVGDENWDDIYYRRPPLVSDGSSKGAEPPGDVEGVTE
jgi:hypothetical protein